MRMLTHMLPCMGPGAPPCPPRARHTRYVGERTTEQRTYERLKDDPNIETYVMGIKSLNIDALVVRNHAPFAAFACSVELANLVKRRVYAHSWDKAVPHVGFFAKRDIEPGEELTYLRTDEQPKKGASHRICGCKHERCSGFI